MDYKKELCEQINGCDEFIEQIGAHKLIVIDENIKESVQMDIFFYVQTPVGRVVWNGIQDQLLLEMEYENERKSF